MCALDDPWVARKDGQPEVPPTQTFASYGVPWAWQVVGHDTIPKLIGAGSLIVVLDRIETAFSVVMWFVIGAWAVDFGLGVLRAMADPEVELRVDKARNGLMRLLVIPLIAIVAALLEGMTSELIGWDPAGKFVTTACVAMFWEEVISIQRNGRHFYRSLRLRFSGAPWFGGGDES